VCARLICSVFRWFIEKGWGRLGFDGTGFHWSGGDEEPFFAARQSLAGQLDVAHGSFVGALRKTSFKNILFNLLLGSDRAHHVGLDMVKNLHGDFLMRFPGLPGGGGTSGANMLMGFGLEQVQFVLDEPGMGLVAHRACLVFGNGDDPQFRIDGMIVHGENELGDFGADAGDGAILAVLVHAMLAGDEDGAVVFVSKGEELVPELIPGFGIAGGAVAQELFERIDDHQSGLVLFDDILQAEGKGYELRLFWISIGAVMVFHFVNEIELGLLTIQERGDEGPLQLRRQVEDANAITILGLVAEMSNQGSSQARLADAWGAIEKNEFTLREKAGDEPGLFRGRLLELKRTGHGMLHKE